MEPKIEIESTTNGRFAVDFTLGDIQISGSLIPFETGRTTDYEFETDGWYVNDESEEYYDEHYEKIEAQIMEEFYKHH